MATEKELIRGAEMIIKYNGDCILGCIECGKCIFQTKNNGTNSRCHEYLAKKYGYDQCDNIYDLKCEYRIREAKEYLKNTKGTK